MFINFNPFGDMYTVTLTLFLGNQPVQQQMMQGPEEMLKAQFLSMGQEMMQDKRPMTLRMSRDDVEIWDQFEQTMKRRDCYIEFSNYKKEYDD